MSQLKNRRQNVTSLTAPRTQTGAGAPATVPEKGDVGPELLSGVAFSSAPPPTLAAFAVTGYFSTLA